MDKVTEQADGTGNSLVRCEVCGEELSVDFKECLLGGWPKHHGYTMRLVETPTNLDEVVEEAVGEPFRRAVSEVVERWGT